MNLPEGYRLSMTDPDVWTLYAPSGEVVARFVAGAPEKEIEREAHRATTTSTVNIRR